MSSASCKSAEGGMPAFLQALRRTGTSPQDPPSVRLQGVLDRTRDQLGPTQRAHLTTHAQYVCKMAMRLGKALSMDAADLERLHLAGLCHDLGKFLIPERVLAKRAPLSQEEKTLVGRHAADGADMATMLGADPTTADYIRYHHARFDGAGSRDGLRGKAIPIGARILTVADALVTMTSWRPYQPTHSFTGAVHELRRGGGSQFDPDIVDAVPCALLSDVPSSSS